MGEVIRITAGGEKIGECGRKTLRVGLALGGDVAAAVQVRLAAPIAALDAASAAQTVAADAAAGASAAIMAQHAKCDDLIFMIHDTMWNLVGRTRNGPEMDQAFPGGVTIYTDCTPHQQAMLIQVLKSRIIAVPCARWSEEARKDWVAQLEARRTEYEATLTAYRPLEATSMVAEAAHKTAVRSVHIGLRALKRDLKTAGYTESQIHEIIPDASPPAAKKATDGGTTSGNGTGNGTTPGSPTNAPGAGNANGPGSAVA